MSRDEIQKLVGGYATGTLTPEEQEALFAEALADQDLFNTLAREQALRDLLSDPAAKAEILATLAEPPRRWYAAFGWLRLPAAAVAMAGVALLVVVTVRQKQAPMAVSAPAPLVAEVKPAAPAPQPTSAAPAVKQKARPAGRAAARPAGTRVMVSQGIQTTDTMAQPERRFAPAAEPQPAAPSAKAEAQVAVPAAAPPLPAPAVARNSLLQTAGGGGGGAAGAPTGAPAEAILIYNLASGQTAGAAGAIGGLGGRPAAMALERVSAARLVALRYTFVRQAPEGDSAAAGQELKPGERLEIRFTAAADGYLTVNPPAGAPLFAARVTRLQPVSVPLTDVAGPLTATYSLQPDAPAAPAAPLKETVAGVTYVAARSAQGAIRFTIELK